MKTQTRNWRRECATAENTKDKSKVFFFSLKKNVAAKNSVNYNDNQNVPNAH